VAGSGGGVWGRVVAHEVRHHLGEGAGVQGPGQGAVRHGEWGSSGRHPGPRCQGRNPQITPTNRNHHAKGRPTITRQLTRRQVNSTHTRTSLRGSERLSPDNFGRTRTLTILKTLNVHANIFQGGNSPGPLTPCLPPPHLILPRPPPGPNAVVGHFLEKQREAAPALHLARRGTGRAGGGSDPGMVMVKRCLVCSLRPFRQSVLLGEDQSAAEKFVTTVSKLRRFRPKKSPKVCHSNTHRNDWYHYSATVLCDPVAMALCRALFIIPLSLALAPPCIPNWSGGGGRRVQSGAGWRLQGP